jgi:phosphatidylglycerophosphate synthase
MPPFAHVLKARDVEDPINLWVHRPLAYAFCLLVFRTPITPNMVTVIAMAMGLGAAACWVMGTPAAMVWGGALLWASAIMDGADGILARAKNMQSAFGRALDGMADWIVGLSSVAGCVYHLYSTGFGAGLLLLAVPTALATVVQFNVFDFYKEVHVHNTRIDRRREGHTVDEVERMRRSEAARSAPWYSRLAMAFYEDYSRQQERLTRLTNPAATRLLGDFTRTPESAELYRRLNFWPLQLWKSLSTAPHAYLFSIFGMFDRLDLYLWFRLAVMSAVMVTAFVLQRRATARTIQAFEAHGWL